MSIKEIKEAIDENAALFGIRQALKKGKDSQGVFVAKDARDSTVDILENSDIEFVVLKSKADLAKELNLDFETEVICLIEPRGAQK